jgi:hypothetical protein
MHGDLVINLVHMLHLNLCALQPLGLGELLVKKIALMSWCESISLSLLCQRGRGLSSSEHGGTELRRDESLREIRAEGRGAREGEWRSPLGR